MKKQYILAVFMLLIIGCTSSDLDEYYAQEGGEINRTLIMNLSDPDIHCDPTDKDCVCMICENTNFELLNPFNRFYSIDLEGGTCRFQKECTEELFLETSSAPGLLDILFGQEQVRFFMIGQGSNFAEFADANRYCNNSLRLAVRWLISSEGFEYPLPSEERAECLLEKDVMPMYLLYSNGESIDVARAAEIASKFEDSGPVIISSEFDFTPTNLTQMELAIDQAIAMKAACPNCLIAISPQFEYNRSLTNGEPKGYAPTYEALDYIFAGPYRSSEALSSIDLVGVGMNSHYSKNCMAASLIYDGKSYSQYALGTYGKPSIWAYVLLDENTYNSGGIEQEDCIWTPSEVVKTYSDIYKYLPVLKDSGLIGVAPYSFYGLGTGPLECENCRLMDVDGTQYAQHSVWFSLCQAYYTGNGIMPIVFSPSPCANCSFSNNYNLYQLNQFISGSAPTADELEPIVPYKTFYRCNGQLLSEVPDEIKLSGYIPNIDKSDDPTSTCEVYPELDVFSDIRDADPVLTRSFAWVESGGFNDLTEGPGGDMCAYSQVPETQCHSQTYPIKCLKTLSDPSGVCIGGIVTAPAGKVFHSMGLMQVHTYPEDQWGPLDQVDYDDEARWCGGQEGFNPFTKTDNACLGTAIIMSKLNHGRSFVNDNEGKLGLTSLKNEFGEESHEYLNMKNAYMIFISSYRYSGFITMHSGTGSNKKLDSWLGDFIAQKEVTEQECEVGSVEGEAFFDCCADGNLVEGPCCNEKNFINYLQFCKFPTLSSTSHTKAKYGLKLLGIYKALLECEKYDEGQHEQNLIDYLILYEGNTWDDVPEE